MANLYEWIVDLADGEEVEAVVLGPVGGFDFSRKPQPEGIGQVLTWKQAMHFLKEEFNDGYGYGGAQARSLSAYTKMWIISVYQYDGSTSPFKVARNPMPHEPDMPGG